MTETARLCKTLETREQTESISLSQSQSIAVTVPEGRRNRLEQGRATY